MIWQLICLCDREFSAPGTPIPQESWLSSPFNPPLVDNLQFPETQVVEALIRMKHSTNHYYPSDRVDSDLLSPPSPMVLDLPELSFLSPSTSFPPIHETCSSDDLSPATRLGLTADNLKLNPSPLVRKRKSRVPRVNTVKTVLKTLHDAHISLMDLLFMILSGNDFGWYRLQCMLCVYICQYHTTASPKAPLSS